MSSRLSLLLFVLLVGILFAGSKAIIAQDGGQSNSTIINKKPYQLPFKEYDTFVEFMKGSKFAKPPWSDSKLRASFPETAYKACLSQDSVQFDEVLYQTPNGITRGWTVRPKESTGKLPVVVFNRGGFSKWGRIVAFELVSLCRVAMQGYMVVASDFRGVKDGNGKQDKTDLGYGDVNDSFYLIDAVSREYPDIDSSNIAVWGFSRGTSLSALMASRSDEIRLVILHGMVGDLVRDGRRAEFDEHVYPLLINNYAKLSKLKQDELLAGISPLHLIDKIKGSPAFLIVHGAKDTRTSAHDALTYASRLLKKDYSVEFRLYSESGHTLSGNYDQYINEVIKALTQHMSVH